MKAAVYDTPGTPEVLRLAEVPLPECGRDQVLIAMEAISVDWRDLVDRRSMLPPQRAWIPGYAGAGTVVAVGACVENRQVGDRVAAFDAGGSHAEFWAVPALHTWQVPDGVSMVHAAVLPAAFGAAQHCLFGRGHLRRGESVLIQSCRNAVSLAAVQLAASAGAIVFAVARGCREGARLQEIGAYHVMAGSCQDVAAEVMQLTGARGVDLAFDPDGTSLSASMALLCAEGRLVFLVDGGGMPGQRLNVDLSCLRADQTLSGVLMHALLERPAIYLAVHRLFEMVAAQHLQIDIDRIFSLGDVATAHAYAESTQALGCVVMRP